MGPGASPSLLFRADANTGTILADAHTPTDPDPDDVDATVEC